MRGARSDPGDGSWELEVFATGATTVRPVDDGDTLAEHAQHTGELVREAVQHARDFHARPGPRPGRVPMRRTRRGRPRPDRADTDNPAPWPGLPIHPKSRGAAAETSSYGPPSRLVPEPAQGLSDPARPARRPGTPWQTAQRRPANAAQRPDARCRAAAIRAGRRRDRLRASGGSDAAARAHAGRTPTRARLDGVATPPPARTWPLPGLPRHNARLTHSARSFVHGPG